MRYYAYEIDTVWENTQLGNTMPERHDIHHFLGVVEAESSEQALKLAKSFWHFAEKIKIYGKAIHISASEMGKKGGSKSKGGGRPRKYNSDSERQKAYLERKTDENK